MHLNNLKKENNKNLLVQYQGGFPQGMLVWDWNFFYFDEEGKFHDIWSTGNEGITKEEDAKKLISESVNKVLTIDLNNRIYYLAQIYFYDLTSPEDVAEINTECHIDDRRKLKAWFKSHGKDLNITD